MVAANQSIIRLYPYQQRFLADPARVIEAIWCRQAGKDFATACKAVDHAIRTHQDWFIISKTQRQADATFAKCKQVGKAFAAAFKLVGRITETQGPEYVDYDAEIDTAFRCTARTLHLPGGGTVTSLPGANPDNLAGLTGNVILTEFALFPKGGYEHWRVVFPLSTRGFKVIVITTPRGKNTKAHEIFADRDAYSVHFVDIHQAVAEGMPLVGEDGRPITIDQFKRLYNDPVGWLREYECQWTGDLEALVKWAQLVAAGQAGRDQPFDLVRVDNDNGWTAGVFKRKAVTGGRCEIGWDVARHTDFSSVWINHVLGDRRRSLRYLVLMHHTSFALQRQVLFEAMDASASNVGAGDATGLGMDSNETLANRYSGRWIPITFTARAKSDLASGLATAFDDGSQLIPAVEGEAPHKFIATDIYAVQKESSDEAVGKQLRLVETENPLLPDSHCDIAYSAALARKAAGIEYAQPYLSVA